MFADVTPAAPSVASYLPPTMQMWQFYVGVAVCFAAVGLCKKLPGIFQRQGMAEIIAIVIGQVMMAGIIGFGIYSFGSGLFCAFTATSFFSLLWFFAENKMRALLGIPPLPPTIIDDFRNLPANQTKDQP